MLRIKHGVGDRRVGVKFNREYEDIISELAVGIGQIDDLFSFFGMTLPDWEGLNTEEQNECRRTLADDVFYGLGTERSIRVGSGTVSHDHEHHVVKVYSGDNLISLIHLV